MNTASNLQICVSSKITLSLSVNSAKSRSGESLKQFGFNFLFKRLEFESEEVWFSKKSSENEWAQSVTALSMVWHNSSLSFVLLAEYGTGSGLFARFLRSISRNSNGKTKLNSHTMRNTNPTPPHTQNSHRMRKNSHSMRKNSLWVKIWPKA